MVTAFRDYVMAAPTEVQGRLMDVLVYLAGRLPDAERRIYHEFPAFFLRGRDVICVGAYKDHLGVCVGYDMVGELKGDSPAAAIPKPPSSSRMGSRCPWRFLKLYAPE